MSLKVFDLQCEHSHVFEGWFASADAYESQKSRGLLSCPVCSSTNVNRKVSAARLNVGHLKRERLEGPVNGAATQQVKGASGNSAALQEPSGADLARVQAEVIRHLRKVLSETENVGSSFAQESRRIHYGDAEARPIRGTATLEERAELADEGIAVSVIPDFLDDDRLQ
ncbi:DUF1178 family protein [Achromobacter sp. F4_2707]|uniref:DUF1178 family protein n=1 Tax=Achromobacter sp. F4_2707 TaxID=3114286 RepID=UPI0039C6BEA3